MDGASEPAVVSLVFAGEFRLDTGDFSLSLSPNLAASGPVLTGRYPRPFGFCASKSSHHPSSLRDVASASGQSDMKDDNGSRN